jgi:hypothetical protein
MKDPVKIQKGKMSCSTPPTRKMQTREEIAKEDHEERVLRKDGQTLHYMSPKQ